MSKINIFFNNKDYLIDESAFSSASNQLKSHLLNVMNGSGAVINFGGTSYNVDSTKLSKVRNDFVSHLGTISGNGSKVSVNGIEYNVDSSKIASVVSELETVFGSLESDSLVYELAEPVTLNGTSDYIDTGVKLYDTDKDFEIMIEFENPTNQNMETLIHCMYEDSPWTGLTMKYESGGFNTHIVGSSMSNKVIGHNGITRYAIAKINDYYCIKIMHEGLTKPEVVFEVSTGYGKVDNNLLIGAYQDNSGKKGRFFSGTISKCKVYFDELPSAEETDAFLIGESTPDEPELPDRVLYSLVEPTTFNGTSDYIDTGVKLYDYDKDFTILADFTSGENTGLEHGILSCMNVNNSIYYGLNIDVGTANNALGMASRGGNGYISGTSSNFGLDCEDIQGMNIKMVIVKRGNTTTVKTKYDGVNGGQILSGNVGYRQFDNTLILGARYDIQHFWNGTINSCVIYNTVLSDEEVDEFLNFTTVEATSDIVWSETPAYGIDPSTGAVVSGQDYVSEMFTLEDGYVYELKQPTGGSWIRYAMYDVYGNFKYTNGVSGDGDLYIDSFGDNRLRITVYPASPDELDLNTVVPVKTDRIWSTEKYNINRDNGTITWNGLNDYFTLQKIPVEGGATYKLSTSGTHTWLSWCEYAEDGTYLGYKETGESPKVLETTVRRNTSYVVLTVYGGEGNCDEYVTFVKTADAATIIPNIVWSDTSTYSINAANGDVISGDAYVSEPFSIESGYVYSLHAPTGGAWHGFAVYDSDGNFKYYKEAFANSGKETLYIDGFEDTVIRLRVWKQNDTLDLSEFSPVKTDRIWSTQKYACSDTGVFTYNNSYDYITLQKIPVEGGATYKLSTTGTHTYLCWKEYAEDGTYLGLKETGESSSEALEATVNSNTTHVILTVYGGESNVDDYVTFVKMADAPEV